MKPTTDLGIAQALGFADVRLHHFVIILARLVIASALGALVAYRPWRRFVPGSAARPETAQAQTMIAAVGAVLVAVIGDSTARAFGLVGLGGFLRFRSVIKDTRDAASMFVMIGIGMACGLGVVPIAIVSACFFSVIIAIFDLTSTGRPKVARVGVTLDDPHAALGVIRSALGGRILETPTEPGAGLVLLECEAAVAVDAGAVLERLRAEGVVGVRGVKVED